MNIVSFDILSFFRITSPHTFLLLVMYKTCCILGISFGWESGLSNRTITRLHVLIQMTTMIITVRMHSLLLHLQQIICPFHLPSSSTAKALYVPVSTCANILRCAGWHDGICRKLRPSPEELKVCVIFCKYSYICY